jgi:iron complex outermembrane receptor protein
LGIAIVNGRACLLSVVLVALGVPAAWAQSDDSVVVVSGRRVEQTLRDVPASLTVVQAAEIARAGLVKLRDVADLAPNFSMLDNYRPGLDRIQMRGLITPQVGDPPVAFVIDGVTAPSPEFVTQPLFDIARVEVLRGAQGALYGRSSLGGALTIYTAPPTELRP